MSDPALSSTTNISSESATALLEAFREHYHRFSHTIGQACQNPTDSVVLSRIGDDLDEFLALANEVRIYIYLRFSKRSEIIEKECPYLSS